MLPPPEGLWGMPPEIAEDAPRLWPRCRRRTAPRRARSWRSSATGRTSGSPIKVSTRNIADYRDPAVILIDQLKEIYIDGELDTVDTAIWHRQGHPQGLPSASTSPAAASTIPTSNSTRITPAARSATTPATAIPSSTS